MGILGVIGVLFVGISIGIVFSVRYLEQNPPTRQEANDVGAAEEKILSDEEFNRIYSNKCTSWPTRR